MDEEPRRKRQKLEEPSTSGTQDQNADGRNDEERTQQSCDSKKQNESDDDSMGLKARDCYDIETNHKQERKKFKTEVVDHVVRFNRGRFDRFIADRDNMMTVLHEIFDSLIETLMADFDPHDRVSIQLHVPGSDRPIWVPLMRREDIDADKILNAIQKVQQSNSSLMLELLEIHILRIRVPSGSGSNGSEDGAAKIKSMKSILQIKNKDSLCLPRALVTARAFIEEKERNKSQWDKIRNDSKNEQKRLAMELCQLANVEQGPFDLKDVSKFQDVLPEYQILVTELHPCLDDMFLFKGTYKENKLCLLYHEKHFHVINSMKGFLNSGYFCGFCLKRFSTFEHHRCDNICLGCFNNVAGGCSREGEDLHCQKCNRYFQSKSCFERHQKTPLAMGNKTKKTICDRIRRCDKCNRTIKDQHECGKAYCHTCQTKQPLTHQCFMQVIEESSLKKCQLDQIYIFFDIECRQDEELKEGTYLHTPNLCIAQRVCGLCILDNNLNAACENCQKGEFSFKGDNTVKDFCNWLLSNDNWGAIAIAHNMKGYDGHFILSYLENSVDRPRIIKRGSKIMLIEISDNKKPKHMKHRNGKKLKIIDSFNFIPIALSGFPNTFGITETKKGYFPHFFNTKENEDYIGDWPDKKYYRPNEMKKAQAEDFKNWYDKQKGKTFNMQKEIFEYCKSDVELLRRGCSEFRSSFLDATGLDPFEKSVTIASACMFVFRKCFLNKDTIAVVPHDSYRKKIQQSKMAIQWLKWREHSDNVRIKYVGNGGEVSIEGYKVDGFCETQKRVYEFYGCYWHGCPKCYSTNRGRALFKDGSRPKIHELYQRVLHRKRCIIKAGYKLEEIWECDFQKQLRQNCVMKKFVDQLTVHEPLNPRDAFYGGRNNAIKLWHKARQDQGETVKYIDICSLYPWVNKYGKYPVGHPEILTEDLKTDIEQYEGFIKCTILPPDNLFHPVLPYRCGSQGEEKLLFPLCASCAQCRLHSCDHSEKERALYGTWVTDELKKAVEMGYKVLEVHEIWNFKDTKKYDPEKKEKGLFTEYVNTFLKLKQEADGWPSYCTTEKQKSEFVLEYKKRGIDLEKSNICTNKGKRTLAKLMLNSFWGKFGQRSDLSRTDYVQTKDDYFKFILDETKIVNSVSFTNDGEKAIINWTHKQEHVETMPNTNIFIAAYTTAMARLKLYTYLEKLKERVLYFDTDSVIYISKEGEYDPPTGSFLGDMTDELCKDYGEGSYITEFVSGGPKNYGYQVYSTGQETINEVCKIKGFTLNVGTSQHLNFSAMRNILQNVTNKVEIDPFSQDTLHLSEETITTPDIRIKRSKQGNIVTKHAQKVYRMLYDKRILNYDDFTTLPFGFKTLE